MISNNQLVAYICVYTRELQTKLPILARRLTHLITSSEGKVAYRCMVRKGEEEEAYGIYYESVVGAPHQVKHRLFEAKAKAARDSHVVYFASAGGGFFSS